VRKRRSKNETSCILCVQTSKKVQKTAKKLNEADWKKYLKNGIWMGETGGAYNSGRNTITNRFMSAFWYLDWLGILANEGHKGKLQ
jgi:heparanase 1